MKKVVVVVPNYNGSEYAASCIESVRQSDYGCYQLVVVDDCSTDASPDEILERFPDIPMIRNPRNRGQSIARNQGIRWALEQGTDYVLILDNDTVIDRSLISQLVAKATAYDDSVVVSPKIYLWRDPARLWFIYARFNLYTGIYRNPAYNQPDFGQFDNIEETEVVSACCALIPRDIIIKVGMLDPSFLACEDLEYSIRCRRAGVRLVCAPDAKLVHRTSGTWAKGPANMRYLMTRYQLAAIRKNASSLQLLSHSMVYPIRALCRILMYLRALQYQCVFAELKGAKDGFFAPLVNIEADK